MLNYSLAADAKAPKRPRGESEHGELKSNVERRLDLKAVAYESLTYLLPRRAARTRTPILLSSAISTGKTVLCRT